MKFVFFFFVGYLEQGERTLGPLMPPKSQVRQRNPIEISLRMVRLSFLKAAQLMIVTCHPHGSCLTTDAGWLAAHRLAAKKQGGSWDRVVCDLVNHIISYYTYANNRSIIYVNNLSFPWCTPFHPLLNHPLVFDGHRFGADFQFLWPLLSSISHSFHDEFPWISMI